MYVYNGNLTNASAARGSGRKLVSTAFSKLGTPLAPTKQQAMTPEGTSWESTTTSRMPRRCR
eukprot:3725040-Heterocapsa_arctica.AAC.1